MVFLYLCPSFSVFSHVIFFYLFIHFFLIFFFSLSQPPTKVFSIFTTTVVTYLFYFSLNHCCNRLYVSLTLSICVLTYVFLSPRNAHNYINRLACTYVNRRIRFFSPANTPLSSRLAYRLICIRKNAMNFHLYTRI